MNRVWATRLLFVTMIVVAGELEFSWLAVLIFAILLGAGLPFERRAFAEGFVLAFFTWGLAAFIQDIGTDYRLGARIAEVFHLPAALLAYALTGLVAGLLAGAAAESAQSARKFIVRR